LHQVGDLFELNVKLRCQKVKHISTYVVPQNFHMSGVNEARKYSMWIEVFRGPGAGTLFRYEKRRSNRGLFKIA